MSFLKLLFKTFQQSFLKVHILFYFSTRFEVSGTFLRDDSEWVNKWVRWVSKVSEVSEMNKWVRWVSDWVSEVSEWVSVWVTEWMNELSEVSKVSEMSEVSEWVSEMSGWVRWMRWVYSKIQNCWVTYLTMSENYRRTWFQLKHATKGNLV